MQDDASLPAQWAREDTSHLETSGTAGDASDFSEPLIIYNDRRQAIQKLNRRMMFAAPLIGIYAVLLASLHLYLIAVFIVAQLVFIYLWVVRRFNKNVTPLMQVDSSGVTIHGLLTHCHIDWENLKEVRPYTFIYKFVGMDVHNIWKLQASVPMKLFFYYNSIARTIYKVCGIKLHAINVPEQYSHFKAEDICEQIEERRKHFLLLHSTSASTAKQSLPKSEPANVNLLNAENPEKSD
ncbi:MAG TPA: hypothetical protein V6C89_06485 [Drouetiella sp.]|jgi:hypothetical protein